MDKIVWDECFSVGVAELDRQHKMLIGMINKLVEAKDVAVDSEDVSHLLSEMTRYTEYHFKTEEQYLTDYDYPDVVAHKKQHGEFMEQTHAFCMSVIDHKSTVPAEMLLFLKKWLISHILKTDMQFKPYFEEKGVK